MQEVDAEVADLYREFQGEREELLDGLRLLGQQLALRDAVIDAFVPQVCGHGALSRRARCGAASRAA